MRTPRFSNPIRSSGARIAAAAVLLAASASGCSGSHSPQEGALPLPEGAAVRELRESELTVEKARHTLMPGRADETDRWSVTSIRGEGAPLADLPLQRTPAGSLLLPPPHSSSWLATALRVNTTRVDRVRVEAVGWRARDLVTFCWAGGQDDFVAERCVHESLETAPSAPVELELAGHPEWRGVVERVQIQITTLPDRSLELGAITLLEDIRRPSLAADELAGPWRTRLGDTVRDAWATAPGTAATWTGSLQGRRRELRVAFGSSPGTRANLSFKIWATVGSETRLLHEADVPWEAGRPPAWRTVTLPLESAGPTLRLHLETEVVEGPGDRGLALWSVSPPSISSDDRPGVLLVSLDTLRRDRMSLYGYERDTTPALAAWAARRAVVFERALAAAPWTLPSHTSLLTGQYPFRHGVVVTGPLPRGITLLAERFREAGYHTRASTVGPILSAGYGFDRGFEEFRTRAYVTEKPLEELNEGVDEAIEFLSRRGSEPFFYFLHTYEAHGPYHRRQPFHDVMAGTGVASEPEERALNAVVGVPAPGFQTRGRLELWPPDPEHPVDLDASMKPALDLAYDSGVAYLDSEMGRLLEAIERLGLDSRTIVVITSDHGESLFDSGRIGHNDLVPEVLDVPLLIAAPGAGRAGSRVAMPVSGVDVAPTLLELAGLEVPDTVDGRSLLPLLEGRPAEQRRLLAYDSNSNRGLLIREPDGYGYRLFDTVWDPARGRDFHEALAAEGRSSEERETVRRRLRNEALALLAAEVPAVRVRFDNRESTPMRVRIVGATEPAGITSTDLDFPCCRWEAAAIRVEVPPGRGFTLLVQDRVVGPLRLHEDSDARAPILAIEELAAFRGPVAAQLANGEWRPLDGELPAGAAGVTLWRTGPEVLGATDVSLTDAERLEGLRALGYIR